MASFFVRDFKFAPQMFVPVSPYGISVGQMGQPINAFDAAAIWGIVAVPHTDFTKCQALQGAPTSIEVPEIERYNENYDIRHSVVRHFIIDFPLHFWFADVLLGNVSLPDSWTGSPNGTVNLERRLPRPDPVYPNLYADSVELVEVRGAHVNVGSMADEDGFSSNPSDSRLFFVDGAADATILKAAGVRTYTNPGKAIVQVTFRRLPYNVLSDNVIGSNGPYEAAIRAAGGFIEQGRYVDWHFKLAGDAVVLPSVGPRGFAFAGSPNERLPQGTNKPLPLGNFKVRWSRVPFQTVAMLGFYGTINDSSLTFVSPNNNITFGAETLFYAGAEDQGVQFLPSGMGYRDYELNFIYRPTGWNNIYSPSAGNFRPVTAGGVPVGREGPHSVAGNVPFQTKPFSQLFMFP